MQSRVSRPRNHVYWRSVSVSNVVRIREPIRSVERMPSEQLTSHEHEDLTDRLFEIFDRTIEGYDRESFQSSYLGQPGTVLGLCRGARGELAGVVSTRLTELELGGVRGAVFSAAVFFDLAYRGGAAAARFGLIEALRFKLRHPLTPLAYMSIALSPAPYVLHTRVMSRIYPRRGVETPASILAWMSAAAQLRGFSFVRPGIIDAPARPRQSMWLERSSLSDDPDAAFFVEMNPDWRDGHALQLWAPLDLPNVLGSLPRALRPSYR
jgi:hypothetical protein